MHASTFAKTTIYHADGRTQEMHADSVRWYCRLNPEWSTKPPPPKNWMFEIPRYRISMSIRPAEKARFRHETPFVSTATDVWQYGERAYEAGEIIETKCWPHPRFIPMNYAAEAVYAYFQYAPKSRLTLSPWYMDRIRLEDGMTNAPMPAPGPVRPEPVALAPQPAR